jgi:hypothetical protein
VQEKRAFSNAARADERHALPIAQQAQDLVCFNLPAVKLLHASNGAAVEKWVVDAHGPILRLYS